MNYTDDEKRFVESILDFNHDLTQVQAYIKENFNIESEYDEEEGALHIWCENVNESLELASAKEYVNSCIDESMLQVVYGRA